MLPVYPRLGAMVLRLALLTYPPRFRRKFESAIRETFGDRFAEAHRQNRRGRFLFTFFINAVLAGIQEQIHPTIPADVPSSQKGSLMLRLLDNTIRDGRYALRNMIRRPAFTLTAVATLALGFGANTAIFSVVNSVLLEPLDYVDPHRLVRVDVDQSATGGSPSSMSYPDLADILTQSSALETLVGYVQSNHTLTGFGEPTVVAIAGLTDGLLSTFQLAPIVGRDIRADEFGPNAASIIVISHQVWQTRFGADPNVIGITLTLNAVPREIIGVAPPGFDFPGNTSGWIPRQLDPEGCGRGCHTMRTIGRLALGTTPDALQAELGHIAQLLESEYPDVNTGKRFLARSLQDFVVGDIKQGLSILMAAVTLVLLIACANVANLLLAAAAARDGEVAVRVALGAGRGRLMAQVFTEGLVLSAAGAAAGLGLAYFGIQGFRTLAAGTIPRVDEIAIDGTVLLWTLSGIVVVTVIFGLVPAFSISRAAPSDGLASTNRRGGSDRRAGRLRAGLLAAEVGLSTSLLIGAGLLLRTFASLYAVELGYEADNILRFRLGLPEAQYQTLDEVRTFYRTLEEQIAAMPGVNGVTSVFGPPFGRGRASSTVYVAGQPQPRPEDEKEAYLHAVSPGFLETMRMPLIRGRDLDARDDVGTGDAAVAMVNETFVREMFPNEDPIGKVVEIHMDFGYGSPDYLIVGIVADTRWNALETTAPSSIYVPHGRFGPSGMYVVIRTEPNTPPVLPAVRETIRALDATLPMYTIETFADVLKEEMAPTKLYLSLVTAFAISAALLAAIGLYGVVSYIVASRTRELGVRIALGANRSRIMRQVIGRGMLPVLVGLVIGFVLSVASGRIIMNLLYGVQPFDPATFAAVFVLLTTIALAALLVPALRASSLSPASTLRLE